MHQLSTEHINKVPARQGWLWINEGVRYVVRAKLVWISTLLFYGVTSLFLVQLGFFFQLLLIFIAPFITAGLSLACADIEQGRPMTTGHLFKAFTHRNSANLLRYGLVLLMMMVLAQIVASLLLGAYGVSQQQVIEEMNRMTETQQKMSWFSLFDSPIISAYIIAAVLSVLPVLVINMLAPIIVVFSPFSAMVAAKMSFIAGMRNVSAFLLYAAILLMAVVICGFAFYLFSQLLINIFGEESIVGSSLYMLVFFSTTFLLISVSYSSAYVAFKDLFMETNV